MTANSPGDEKKRATRFSADLRGSIQIEGRDFPCRATNLSRSGVLMIGEVSVPPASEVWITVSSASGDLQLTTIARVVRVGHDADDEGKTVVALEFLSLRGEDKPTLEALVARVVEGVSPGALQDIPDKATPQETRAVLDRIPLPHRAALATRGGPKEREILIRDSNLLVIDAMSRNPGLLPHEVMSILRMPNLLPQTLDTIAKDSRWGGSEAVMIRVATHRATPLPTALALINRLPHATLKKIIRAPDLHPALRTKLLSRLPRQGPR
jgi:hypothetical protein